MNKEILNAYCEWSLFAKEDKDLIKELKKMSSDEIFDAFYKELSFGTAGLRGVLGAGSNRMNIYIVRKATQGLANYLRKEINHRKIKVAIGYDSRIKSNVFAREAASVLAENDIHVYFYKQLMPAPCVSFATRELHCDAGIMITASHNPAKYNGYKVYGNDGCQISSLMAEKITKEISRINPFDVKTSNFNVELNAKNIEFIEQDLITKFIDRVKQESVLENEKINKSVSIVYSPLNGTGLLPVTRILKECGFNNVKIVKEQAKPNGNFPTCPYPNPEIREAMELGIRYAQKYNADLLIATDPDCDRVGIAVKDKNNYKLLSGNQTGVLLLNYIAEMRTKNGTMPKQPHAVKTIVTSDMVDEVAKQYKIVLHSVLTGFKNIGSVIRGLEAKKQEKNFILGFEESYGYLTGTHVRDKDAVNASLLIAEMFAYYKTHGITLIDKLNELYKKHGFFLDKLDTFTFEGASGFKKMQDIMSSFRKSIKVIGGLKVKKTVDYLKGVDGLPKSDVIKFHLANGSTVVVRPSGTEPKLKLYSSIRAKDEKEALIIYKKIIESLRIKFK